MKKFFILITVLIFSGMLFSNLDAKENFRIRLDYRLNSDAFTLAQFDSKDYSVFAKNVPQDYFGDWLFFWSDTYGNQGGLLTKGFSHKEGDRVPLMQSREIVLSEINSRLGLGAELRLSGDFWLTFKYNNFGKAVINSLENLDSMIFWLILEDPINYSGYRYYHLWLIRKATIRLTTQELNSNNYQIGFSGPVMQGKGLALNWLAGFDFWSISQTTRIEEKTYSLRPWIGVIHGQVTDETTENVDKQKLIRVFCGLELQVPIYRALKVGMSGKYCFGKNEVEFGNQLLLKSMSDSWKVKIPRDFISLSLILGF